MAEAFGITARDVARRTGTDRRLIERKKLSQTCRLHEGRIDQFDVIAEFCAKVTFEHRIVGASVDDGIEPRR